MQGGRRAPAGFTLIEVLVVLIVVGIAVSGASLGLDALRARDTTLAAERLRFVLEATAERAQIRGQPHALELLSDGYRFSALDVDGRWAVLDEPPVFAEKLLPQGMHWELRIDGRRADRIVFGHRTPRFEIRLTTPDALFALTGSETGAVVVRRLAEAGA